MEIKASLKNLRISPRKARLVIDLVRGQEATKAMDVLSFTTKHTASPLLKLIKSAVANAEHNYGLDKNNLRVKEIKVDEGRTLHRWMPKAHGRATPINKRTCHIILVLDEIKASGVKAPKKTSVEAPVKLGEKVKENVGVKTKGKKEDKKAKEADINLEKGKEIVDPRMEGRHGHAKIEGGSSKGFVGKMFRRKSG